jgi:hypothetical protein
MENLIYRYGAENAEILNKGEMFFSATSAVSAVKMQWRNDEESSDQR